MHHPSGFELLEARIAPAAAYLNSTTASFTDVDGDHATVHFTKPVLTPSNVDTIVVTAAAGSGMGEQLQTIDLSSVAAAASGTSIFVTARVAGNGDGFVNVGAVKAAGISLGAVYIHGDLGAITAGVTNHAALGSLTVASMGVFGMTTGATSVVSTLNGSVGAIRVAGDVLNEEIEITGALGLFSVGGSVTGEALTDSGCITAHSIGTVFIGGDLRGGAPFDTGMIESQTTMGSVTIRGSILGGAGGDSGEVLSFGNMGRVSVGGDVVGGTGTNAFSGVIDSHGKLAGVQVVGSVVGGAGGDSGEIISFSTAVGALGPVFIGHDLMGGNSTASFSGVVDSHGTMASVTIGRGIIGGSGPDSGEIYAVGNAGPIRAGDIRGGGDTYAGAIHALANVASVTIGGPVTGGTAIETGLISSGGDMGLVLIRGNLHGSTQALTGTVSATGKLAGVLLGGSLQAGAGSGGVISSNVSIGPVFIAGDIEGGAQLGSGDVSSLGDIASVSVGGSLIGGTGGLAGQIQASGILGPVHIGKNIQGASNSGSGTVADSGTILADTIKSVFVGGSILAGTNSGTGVLDGNALIHATKTIGSVTVLGDVVGTVAAGGETAPVISAGGHFVAGARADVAIGSVVIGGRMEHAAVLAGYDANMSSTDTHAGIGLVSVGGSYIASRIAAGTNPGGDNTPGTGDDGFPAMTTAPFSSIGRVIIGGEIFGTAAAGDVFRIIAEKIGSVTVGGSVIPLGTGATDRFIGNNGDVEIFDIL